MIKTTFTTLFLLLERLVSIHITDNILIIRVRNKAVLKPAIEHIELTYELDEIEYHLDGYIEVIKVLEMSEFYTAIDEF